MDQNPIKGIQKALAILITSAVMLVIAITSYININTKKISDRHPIKPIHKPIKKKPPELKPSLTPKTTAQKTVDPKPSVPGQPDQKSIIPESPDEPKPTPKKLKKQQDFKPSDDGSIIF